MSNARIIFGDGTEFQGRFFSTPSEKSAEVVFNTAMSGYQEILTDPSYKGQFVLMTYPMIGNYGVNDDDQESHALHLEGLIVREYVDEISNWRANKTLKTYLEENNKIGLTGVDTRALTLYLREFGARTALVTASDAPASELIKNHDLSKNLEGVCLATDVSCTDMYQWKAPETEKYTVAVIDCGCKHNILELLREGGCACDVYPATATSEQLLSKSYDGYFISNGPGDPEPATETISLVQDLIGKKPLYGICLGHQIISLALGAKTYKLKFGHHGANHPVQNIATGQVEISSQNHGFAVDPTTLEDNDLELTHVNLNDQTVSGIKHKLTPTASVQYHPEASPGPHDSRYFFKDFFALMDTHKAKTTS